MLDWKQVVGRPMLKLRCSAAVTECKTASYGEGRPQDLFLSRRSMKPCPVVLVGEPEGVVPDLAGVACGTLPLAGSGPFLPILQIFT